MTDPAANKAGPQTAAPALPPLPKLLSGQKALVTGANSGIGKAVALALAEAGADVGVNYVVNPEQAEEVAKAARAFGGSARIYQGDVSSEADVTAMVSSFVADFGAIDILVANAGLQRDASIAKMTLDEWNKVISVNLTGQFLCARAAIAEFRKQGDSRNVSRARGKIIHMSSVHQMIPWAGHVNYASSKGGIMLMMQSLAQECAPDRIRINSIAPGAIRTPINHDAWATQKAYDELMTLIPYGRIGEPEDIGKVAALLVSDYCDYIVGATIFVDGGMTLFPASRPMVEGADRYDIIIVGSGPGGATAAWRLAPTGKRVLLIERGGYLPRERENWDTHEVFGKARYQADENWKSADGATFKPGLHYWVGGNSKLYGAALFRLRETDFHGVRHVDGVSPEWPLKYDVFEPYYGEAEKLYRVHGVRGEDPTEPWASAPYPKPPIKHEPRIAELADGLKREGLHPFHMPMGAWIEEDENGVIAPDSPCLRCDPFDGYPSLTNGKADAQVVCVDPTLKAHRNVTLMTGAYVERLLTDASGRNVTGVETTVAGERRLFSADIVIVACGALSSALLFLRSANDKHPRGLANSSDQVGRNYMRHNNATVLAISRTPNPTQFQKTLGLNDFYHGKALSPANAWEFPLGHIQMVGKSDGAQVELEGLPPLLHWLPQQPFDWIARHSIDFWLTTEDLPRADNRVYYRDSVPHLDVVDTNKESAARLREQLRVICDKVDIHPHLLDRRLYFGKDVPVGGTAHQAGTMRFGEDPLTSVLDLDCRTHELDNLYVVDASFFPSIGAVNPTLTLIANSLRVADIVARRMG